MSNQKNESMELTEQNTGFAALANMNTLEDVLGDDCAGLDFQLDRVKLPAGGGTAFELPSDDGEGTDMVKEIRGVIVYSHPAYAYYHDKYAGGNNPPDCGSFDGVIGCGNPGGECVRCPYNQFGSGEGKSKACKNKRMLYILQEGELFPIVMTLPTGSLMTFTKYVKSQLSKGRKLSEIVTKISLRKAVNAGGIAFSQAVFGFERVLNPAEREALAPVSEQMRQYAAKLGPAAMGQLAEENTFVDPETGEIIEPLK